MKTQYNLSDMMISGWEKRYLRILKELGYSQKKDRESAIILDSILKKTNTGDKILKLIEGKTVFVIGSGPSLSNAIPKLKKLKKSIKIAADSSLKPLVDNGIIPDIIVTDLDGDENTIKKIAKTKSIFVIHAHGDNIEKLEIVLEQLNQIHLIKFKILGDLLMGIEVFSWQIILVQKKLSYLEWILEIELVNFLTQKNQIEK